MLAEVLLPRVVGGQANEILVRQVAKGDAPAALHLTAASASVLCPAPALAGMWLGQMVRARVAPATFRVVFFVGLLVLGGDLAVRSLV